jgi:hypothetical protein
MDNLALPPINIPNLPDGIQPDQVTQLFQQIVAMMLQPAISQAINEAVGNLMNSLPLAGFQRAVFNTQWKMEA